jgi:membrane dipeptidase
MTKIFDLHCDTVWRMEQKRAERKKASLQKSDLQVDEEKLIAGGYFAQCFAVFTPNEFKNPYEKCLRAIDLYHEELKKCKVLAPAYEYADFQKNASTGKISAVLTMEDGCPIGEDFSRLDRLYRLGVRMICLTHNLQNQIGYPNFLCGTSNRCVPNVERGLTEFGKQLVKRMNEIGITIDLSHLSDKGFYDVLSCSEKPVLLSHSNARSVCGHVRNVSDDMLKKLAENGGAIGINCAKQFLSDDATKGAQTVASMVEHILYIKNKIGVGHIAIGSDFDGIDRDIQLSDASKTPLLIRALEQANLTADEIDAITHKNVLRVFKESWK